MKTNAQQKGTFWDRIHIYFSFDQFLSRSVEINSYLLKTKTLLYYSSTLLYNINHFYFYSIYPNSDTNNQNISMCIMANSVKVVDNIE